MKKSLVISILSAVVVFGCSKKEVPPVPPTPEIHEYSVVASLSSGASYLLWDKNDSISVFCKEGVFQMGRKGNVLADTATFSVKTDKNSFSPEMALYPGDASAVFSNDVVSASLPARQSTPMEYASRGNSLYLGCPKGNRMVFYDVCAGIDFTLVQEGVSKVTIASDTPLAGKVSVMMISGEPSVIDIIEGCDSVSLVPADGDVFKTGSSYHISLLPGICSNGYTLIFETDSLKAKKKVTTQQMFIGGEYLPCQDIDQGLYYEPKYQPEVAPDRPGMNVKGIVWNADTHKGIEGVVVSDGMKCTKTNEFGVYYLNSDMNVAKNVFVVMPSEYELTFNSNYAWNNFKHLNKSLSVNNCDFNLTPRKESSDNFKMLMMGDPQQMSSRPHSSESWTYVTTNLNKYRQTVTGLLYEMFLGDMVTNEIEVDGKADAYFATLKKSGIGSFHVPGNHDHWQQAQTYYDSIKHFANYFGPYNYAFNIGKVHFIGLDSVNWTNGSYTETLNDEALTFLENDLKYVPEDRVIMICTHCPLTKKHGGSFPSPSCRTKLFNLLKGRTVHFWYGHIHFGVNFSYTNNELKLYASGVKSLDSHIVSRCGGAWCCSGEVCRDGTPRGFVEIEANGNDIKWHFHSFDPNYDHDCNVYLPGQFIPDKLSFVDNKALYVNIYLWDNAWGTPEWWVNGKKVGAMTKVTDDGYDATYDPLYGHFFPIWKNMGIIGFRTNEDPKAYDNSHLFKIVPESGIKSGEIRYKDRWDQEHTVSVHL